MKTKQRRILAVAAPTAVLFLTVGLFQLRPTTALFWLIGLAMGFVMHRSRFCVAAAFRDSALFHDGGPARAVLLALGLSTVSFAWIQYNAGSGAVPGNIYPISAATVVGAFLFGIGIMPAGGCVCSTVLRIGEGHLRFVWTLGGLIVGSVLGARHFGWWEKLVGTPVRVHLPAELGWVGALALQAALLGALLLLVGWWERKGAESQ